jgi:hypothetical protein
MADFCAGPIVKTPIVETPIVKTPIDKMALFAKYAKRDDELGALSARLAAYMSQGELCNKDFIPTCDAIISFFYSHPCTDGFQLVVAVARHLSLTIMEANDAEKARKCK